MAGQSLVTISLFRYQGAANKWWAFQQMGRPLQFSSTQEQPIFYKLLGSGGKQGFSMFPNFGVYAFICTWKNLEEAQSFFKKNPIFLGFCKRSFEHWTVYLQTTMAHGQWSGQNPFEAIQASNSNGPIGVITRATINPSKLLRFWKHVPATGKSIEGQEGLIFSVGIGELPLIQQATFSLWENRESMLAFAYKSKHHKEVVRKTRSESWYKEELFARFEPLMSEGRWNGKDLLADYF